MVVIGTAVVVGAGVCAGAGAADAAGTLGAAAAGSGRDFGTAVQAGRLGEAAYVETLDREFTSVTPENEMKWDAVEPARGTFVFTAADRIVEHARARGMKIRGHTLVWHPGLPGWLTNLSSAEFRIAVNNHIATVMGHWRGQIDSWDVVNEAFQDGSGALRSTIFRSRLGDGYIEEAFRAARAADPAAKLCYNDYNIEDADAAKTRAVYAMVRDFKERGVPIDCVGVQSHFNASMPFPANYRRTIEQFAALGVDVQITQLDVDGGAAQAATYRAAVEACVAVPRCTGITVWGVPDHYSWRAPNTPLLFDRDYQKKPAYFAVLEALNAAGGEPTPAPTPTPSPTPTPTPTVTPVPVSCRVTAELWARSRTGYVIKPVTVRNTGRAAVSGWTVTFTLPQGHVVTGSWDAVLTVAGGTVTARNAGHNGTLAPGATATFGFQVRRASGGTALPSGYACRAG
nr:endo-1,4-beta-xylanase [Sphaerisporangium rubeum]